MEVSKDNARNGLPNHFFSNSGTRLHTCVMAKKRRDVVLDDFSANTLRRNPESPDRIFKGELRWKSRLSGLTGLTGLWGLSRLDRLSSLCRKPILTTGISRVILLGSGSHVRIAAGVILICWDGGIDLAPMVTIFAIRSVSLGRCVGRIGPWVIGTRILIVLGRHLPPIVKEKGLEAPKDA